MIRQDSIRRARSRNVRGATAAFDKSNLEAARLILADPGKYGGEARVWSDRKEV